MAFPPSTCYLTWVSLLGTCPCRWGTAVRWWCEHRVSTRGRATDSPLTRRQQPSRCSSRWPPVERWVRVQSSHRQRGRARMIALMAGMPWVSGTQIHIKQSWDDEYHYYFKWNHLSVFTIFCVWYMRISVCPLMFHSQAWPVGTNFKVQITFLFFFF